MQAELLVLRLVHVLGGIFWLGSGLFTTFFLLPALAGSGPAAAQVMIGLAKRKLMIVLPVTAILTMLAGIRLMQITSNGFSRDYFALASGKAYAVSAIAAIVAFLLSLVVARPGMAKMAQLSQLAASDPVSKDKIHAEVGKVQRRVTMSSIVAMVLLTLAAAGMAVARYL